MIGKCKMLAGSYIADFAAGPSFALPSKNQINA